MNRRDFVRSTLALPVAAGLALPSSGHAKDAARPPKGRRILIRGAIVLTMAKEEPAFRGDLLIENGLIAALGPALPVGGAEVIDGRNRIMMPGFIETHRHTWQSCLRQLGANWSAAQYFQNNFFRFGVAMRPDDVYAANLIGRVAALDAGITTLLDWSHIMNTPAHADAAIQALRDSSGRSVFAMGWPQAPKPEVWISNSTTDIPDDIQRVRREHFSNNTGMVTLAMAGRGPDFAVIEQVARDLRIARDLDIRTTIHIGFAKPGGILAMRNANLLGPDVTHVHVRDSTEEELDLIAESGGTVSISPLDEMLRVRWRRGLPPVMRTLERNMPVSLSVDSESTSDGSMFSIMRNTLAVGRMQAANPPDNRAEPASFNAADFISTRRVLEMATVDGARTIGLEKQVGTLAVGKSADILLMRADSLAYSPLGDSIDAIVGAADSADIEAIFVAGKVVKWDRRLVDTALVTRAQRLASESRTYLFEKTDYKST